MKKSTIPSRSYTLLVIFLAVSICSCKSGSKQADSPADTSKKSVDTSPKVTAVESSDLASLLPSNTGTYDPTKFFTPKAFMKNVAGKPCPSQGEGAEDAGADNPFVPKYDPILNEYKNRDLPPNTYTKVDLAKLISTIPPAITYKEAVLESDWDASVKQTMEKYQSQGIEVDGYFIYAKPEKKESCNCGDTKHTDYHTWISSKPLSMNAPDNPQEDKSFAIVAEFSPFMLGADHKSEHPHWNDKVVNEIATKHLKVRVKGWLTWDKQHEAQLHPTAQNPYAIRATLWEIHPIHEVQVQMENGNWVELDEYQ